MPGFCRPSHIRYAVTVDNHIPRYLYDFGDYQQIVTKLLETDWSQIFDTLSVDDGWTYFSQSFGFIG